MFEPSKAAWKSETKIWLGVREGISKSESTRKRLIDKGGRVNDGCGLKGHLA